MEWVFMASGRRAFAPRSVPTTRAPNHTGNAIPFLHSPQKTSASGFGLARGCAQHFHIHHLLRHDTEIGTQHTILDMYVADSPDL